MGIFGWDYPPGCSGPPEPEDDILGLPPDEWTESAENEPEVDADYEAWWAARDSMADKFEQRDNARLVKPRGKCVNIDGWDV